jgi:tetratricopeptide (TPR) repeat protein
MTKITHEHLMQNFDLLRTDPRKYLDLADELIRSNPDSPDGYFSRSQAWDSLGRKDLALADLNKTLSLEQHWVNYESRGVLLRELGRYREALDDLNRAEATDPERWAGGFGPLFRAECHARLGDETAALADCARLPDDHWTPGPFGSLAGNKAEVIAQVRRLAAEARMPRGS